MVRPTVVYLNFLKLNYCFFINSLDKRKGICNVLSQKNRVPKKSKTKDIYFKVFKMITNKNKAKKVIKHVSCHLNVNSIIQIKRGQIQNM